MWECLFVFDPPRGVFWCVSENGKLIEAKHRRCDSDFGNLIDLFSQVVRDEIKAEFSIVADPTPFLPGNNFVLGEAVNDWVARSEATYLSRVVASASIPGSFSVVVREPL